MIDWTANIVWHRSNHIDNNIEIWRARDGSRHPRLTSLMWSASRTVSSVLGGQITELSGVLIARCVPKILGCVRHKDFLNMVHNMIRLAQCCQQVHRVIGTPHVRWFALLYLMSYILIDQAPRVSVSMELPQKFWPFGNVKGPLVIKYYLDCWQNTGDGLTQEPQ